MKSSSFCLRWSNWNAAPIAFPVQLPSWPWSYTGGHCRRRSTFVGISVNTASGAE